MSVIAELTQLRKRIDELSAEHSSMREALEELSVLGNGERPGNSTGNTIAQKALAAVSGNQKATYESGFDDGLLAGKELSADSKRETDAKRLLYMPWCVECGAMEKDQCDCADSRQTKMTIEDQRVFAQLDRADSRQHHCAKHNWTWHGDGGCIRCADEKGQGS